LYRDAVTTTPNSLILIPETLVQIDPEWDGFLYFVYKDEIVVVDPSDMEIVVLLPV
jgi:hypothetical protein